MPTAAARIILNTALETLAAKNHKTPNEIRDLLADNHRGLRADFDKLVELGRQVAVRTAYGAM